MNRIDADTPFVNIIALRHMMDELKINILTETTLCAVTETGAVIMSQDQRQGNINCDAVVLAIGVAPRSDVMAALAALAPEVLFAGDCNTERGNLYKATMQGYFAGMDL